MPNVNVFIALIASFVMLPSAKANYSTSCLLLLSQLESQQFNNCTLTDSGVKKPISSAKLTAVDLSYKIQMVDENGASAVLDLFKITEDANGNNQFVNGLKTEFVVCGESSLIYQIKTPDYVKQAVGEIKSRNGDTVLEVKVTDKSFRQTSLTCAK